MTEFSFKWQDGDGVILTSVEIEYPILADVREEEGIYCARIAYGLTVIELDHLDEISAKQWCETTLESGAILRHTYQDLAANMDSIACQATSAGSALWIKQETCNHSGIIPYLDLKGKPIVVNEGWYLAKCPECGRWFEIQSEAIVELSDGNFRVFDTWNVVPDFIGDEEFLSISDYNNIVNDARIEEIW